MSLVICACGSGVDYRVCQNHQQGTKVCRLKEEAAMKDEIEIRKELAYFEGIIAGEAKRSPDAPPGLTSYDTPVYVKHAIAQAETLKWVLGEAETARV